MLRGSRRGAVITPAGFFSLVFFPPPIKGTTQSRSYKVLPNQIKQAEKINVPRVSVQRFAGLIWTGEDYSRMGSWLHGD